MKRGLSTLIRLHRWQLDDKRRNVSDLENMRGDLEQKAADLERELVGEQVHAANGEASFAYGSYANAVILRRQTLQDSIAAIDVEMEKKKSEVAEAFRELKKFEIAKERRQKREQLEADRREQAETDELSANMHRR